MAVAVLVTPVLESAREAFNLLLSIGAGTGLIYLLRWYWWRVNAWSEIAAMAISFGLAIGTVWLRRTGVDLPVTSTLVLTVAVATLVWLAVAWLTQPTDESVLVAFYRRARPAGPGWRAIRARAGTDLAAPDPMTPALAGAIGGCAAVYGVLFGTGHALLGHPMSALICLATATIGALVVATAVRRA